jgi:hypothetical protein
VHGIDLACHFFAQNEIELDLVPGAVRTPEQADGLRRFLGGLADLLDREVLLTGEKEREQVYWRIRPPERG